MTRRSGWFNAAWSITRWQSSGQFCISPCMDVPLDLSVPYAIRRQPESGTVTLDPIQYEKVCPRESSMRKDLSGPCSPCPEGAVGLGQLGPDRARGHIRAWSALGPRL